MSRAQAAVRPLGYALIALLIGALLLAGAVTLTARVAASPVPELDLTADDIAPLEEVVERRASVPTTVHAADGSLIATFQPEHTFVPIAPDDIPAKVRAAVLGAEDADFEKHRGFDPEAIVRAALKNASEGAAVQGGSTITQQLAKNLYAHDDRTLERKMRELTIAIELEKRYSKDEILAAYLNSSYFGSGAVGIVAAADTYFAKRVDELTLSDAALLAGALPSPSERNPVASPKSAEADRVRILEQVGDARLASAAEVEKAIAEKPKVLETPRNRVARTRFPYYVDYVRRFALDDLGLSESALFGGGLRIETSLDPVLQRRAEAVVRDRLGARGLPSSALAVVQPRTGQVRALVGGKSWERSKVNLALGTDGGGTGRQPGSSFKAFVLATALSSGWHPKKTIPAPELYTPQGADEPMANASGRGYGTLTIEEATIKSVNTAYAWMTDRLGPSRVAAVARRFGIELPEHVGVSLGIGAYETSPLDMAAAYAALAADGVYAPPTPITRIVDRHGDVVDSAPFERPRRAVSVAVARHVTRILQLVVERGTGRRADIGRPVAGKTGTTNDYRDAWFAGYTPQLAAAAWVGYTDATRSMRGVLGFDRVEGGTIPALVWRDVMSYAHRASPARQFPAAPPLRAAPPPATSGSGGGSGGGGGGGGGDRSGDGSRGKGKHRDDD